MSPDTTASPTKQLVVLGCSATKVEVNGCLPAIDLYDGPTFRVLRSYLRSYRWPEPLSVAVLSAKYGIIGGLSHIATYDERMTVDLANQLAKNVTQKLLDWRTIHRCGDLVPGQG